jgi:glycosyltransferase involved in cell wall biosynthesis
VVTIHDLGYHYFPAAHTHWQRLYLEWSTRWSAWGATRLIAVSRVTANDLGKFYHTPASKIEVVYEAGQLAANHLPVEPTATAAQRILQTRPYALYVGTLQPRKNLPRLLQAYQKLWQMAPLDWDLVIAGGTGWGDEPLQAWVQAASLADQIHFVGYVPDTELIALYRGARFFCLPSLFEGFGLPILEAQSYGVPVMTANNSALPEIAGDAALLVDPTDVDAIAAAMLRLSQDETLRQQLIAAGYANVKRFSWEKAARETLAVLVNAAKQGKG